MLTELQGPQNEVTYSPRLCIHAPDKLSVFSWILIRIHLLLFYWHESQTAPPAAFSSILGFLWSPFMFGTFPFLKKHFTFLCTFLAVPLSSIIALAAFTHLSKILPGKKSECRRKDWLLLLPSFSFSFPFLIPFLPSVILLFLSSFVCLPPPPSPSLPPSLPSPSPPPHPHKTSIFFANILCSSGEFGNALLQTTL